MPTLSEINLYPIKSCAGIALREAVLTEAGLMSGRVHDREWMLVDEQGAFLTQRQHPKMALILPSITTDVLELRSPGLLRLELPLDPPDAAHTPTLAVSVWNDKLLAYDCGEASAAWFSNALGISCRLVRFHPDTRRSADQRWTGGVDVPTRFSDGFPVLVISEASLEDLNHKLTAQGRAALPMNRFRPNLVISGIDPFEEDFADSIQIGDAILKPVKPCPRCPVPSVDQETGAIGPDPLDILRTYRVNPKVDGGISFGMNAILLEGEGQVLRVGQKIDISLAF
jgi:uncharacterized protein YcbX